MFDCGSHLGLRAGSSNTILKEDHLRTIPPKFGINWLSSFGGEDFLRNHSPFFSIFSNGSHIGWPIKTPDTILKGDHSTKVWLKLAQWFQRRRLKCELWTDDGQRTTDDGQTTDAK